MKKMLVYVFADVNTNLDVFKNVIANKAGVSVEYETNEEKFIAALTAQRFDLLILDLDVAKGDYKKAQMMAEMIYPGAAVTELDMQHADFIGFKIDDLLRKWADANTESEIKFFDNPNLGL